MLLKCREIVPLDLGATMADLTYESSFFSPKSGLFVPCHFILKVFPQQLSQHLNRPQFSSSEFS